MDRNTARMLFAIGAAMMVAAVALGSDEGQHARAVPDGTLPRGGPGLQAATHSGFGFELANGWLFEVTLNNPQTLTQHSSISPPWSGAEFGNDDDFTFLYSFDTAGNWFCKVTIATGALTQIGSAVPYGGETWSGLAMDPSTGTMYACSTDYTASSLYTVNLATGAPSRIGAITNGPGIASLAASNSGQLYGVDIINDNLVSISKTTGAGSIVGSLGFNAVDLQGADFDADTNMLYLASANTASWTSELRTVNLSTGATTLIGPLGSTVPGGGTWVSGFAIATPLWELETGTEVIDHNWTTVFLTETFKDPIVVAGPATSNGWQPGVVRIRNVTPTSFQIRFQEWDYLDGWHTPEEVGWIAVERGVHDVTGGGQFIAADSFGTSNTNVLWPTWLDFPVSYPQPPLVLAQVQTCNGSDAVTDRICGVYNDGMHIAMQEQEDSGGHAYEQVGYLAWPTGTPPGWFTPTAVTHKPFLLSTEFGQACAYIREEQSDDNETQHWAAERIGFLNMPGDPPLVADMQTCNGADPCNLRCTLLSQVYRSTVGGATVDHQWQTVSLLTTFVDPVVIAGPATYNGPDPGEIRVRNVTPTSFDIRFQEWNYLDDWHCTEDVCWAALERGIWNTGGTMVIADVFPTSNANVFSPSWVTFAHQFTSSLEYVLATQQTANGPAAVTERLSNIQTTGFNVALQEEEAGDGWHAEEGLGFVAKGPGPGGIVVAASGSRGDPFGSGGGSPEWAVTVTPYTFHVVEEQSLDEETWHVWEHIVEMVPACLPIADMQTCNGTDPCSLRLEVSNGPGSAAAPQEPQALEAAGSGHCCLVVRAQGPDAVEVPDAGVEISVASAEAGPCGTLPLRRVCQPGEVVSLAAASSVLSEAGWLTFSHWELDGEPAEPAQATIQVQMTADHEAVAVYDASP